MMIEGGARGTVPNLIEHVIYTEPRCRAAYRRPGQT